MLFVHPQNQVYLCCADSTYSQSGMKKVRDEYVSIMSAGKCDMQWIESLRPATWEVRNNLQKVSAC
jgi:hypothetical protein